jgi:hypothetical protein
MRYIRLRSLFDPDNIRNSESLQTLKELGKIEGLEKVLKTDYRVTVYLFRKASIKMRKIMKEELNISEITNLS